MKKTKMAIALAALLLAPVIHQPNSATITNSYWFIWMGAAIDPDDAESNCPGWHPYVSENMVANTYFSAVPYPGAGGISPTWSDVQDCTIWMEHYWAGHPLAGKLFGSATVKMYDDDGVPSTPVAEDMLKIFVNFVETGRNDLLGEISFTSTWQVVAGSTGRYAGHTGSGTGSFTLAYFGYNPVCFCGEQFVDILGTMSPPGGTLPKWTGQLVHDE